jgi:hypothetical protein
MKNIICDLSSRRYKNETWQGILRGVRNLSYGWKIFL